MDLFEDAPEDQYDDAGNIVAKVCGMCGELKPIEEFYRNGKGPSGKYRYRRDCKKCYNQANEGRSQAYRDRKWEERFGMPEFYN